MTCFGIINESKAREGDVAQAIVDIFEDTHLTILGGRHGPTRTFRMTDGNGWLYTKIILVRRKEGQWVAVGNTDTCFIAEGDVIARDSNKKVRLVSVRNHPSDLYANVNE